MSAPPISTLAVTLRTPRSRQGRFLRSFLVPLVLLATPVASSAGIPATARASADGAAVRQIRSDGLVGIRHKLGPALARLAAERPDDRVAVWVFFTDRAGQESDPAAYDAARRALPARSLDRRSRRGVLADLVISDLPVHGPYVQALVQRGARLRGTSRWLNAASIDAAPRLAADLARLPFVDHAEVVPRGRRIRSVGDPEPVPPAAPGAAPEATAQPNRGGLHADAARAETASPGDTAYYGGSFRQLDMMQVPALHALGLSGAGVLVCMLDTGFHLTHQAFSGLQVVAARDFIHGDTNVDDEPGQDVAGQASHGSMTLGCVAGWKPGTFVGAAFGATVALGKTEDISSETPVEMDYWQFGAEWADSLGADIISSSLGYYAFDNPADSYTYADMDGRTTVVTLAAVEAMRRGITVVTAAGNEGDAPWHYIIAPGDADSVITCGAVDSLNAVKYFSSRGPTADGRIKPDVTAMGGSVLTISLSNDAGYVRASGTSFSTPLTAGLAALVLEAHPTWHPFEVREALRETALNHAAPNNDMGWGLVQGLGAVSWIPSTTDVALGPAGSGGLQLSAGPNPVRPGSGATIRFSAPAAAGVTLEVLDVSGRRCARLYEGPARTPQSLRWPGVSAAGDPLAAGVYWIRLVARDRELGGVGGALAPGAPPSRALRVVLMP
jgi:serine protease AprX